MSSISAKSSYSFFLAAYDVVSSSLGSLNCSIKSLWESSPQLMNPSTFLSFPRSFLRRFLSLLDPISPFLVVYLSFSLESSLSLKTYAPFFLDPPVNPYYLPSWLLFYGLFYSSLFWSFLAAYRSVYSAGSRLGRDWWEGISNLGPKKIRCFFKKWRKYST